MPSEPPKKKSRHALPKVIFVKAPGVKRNIHQHVRYSTNTSGSLSTSSSTIWNEVRALDSEALTQETELPKNGSAVICDGDEVDFNSTMDESYLQHLDELEPEEKLKSIRLKGVRHSSLHEFTAAQGFLQDESLRDFEPEADLFLEALISLESRGYGPSETCVHCTTAPGVFQCCDCSGREMVCKACIVDSHKKLYLHRIQVTSKTLKSKSVTYNTN